MLSGVSMGYSISGNSERAGAFTDFLKRQVIDVRLPQNPAESPAEKQPGSQVPLPGQETQDRIVFSPELQAALDKAFEIFKSQADSDKKDTSQTVLSSGEYQEVNPDKEARLQQISNELKAIDQRVHAHEMAHLAAAGGLARGGASYSFRTGPDGKRYAVAGEVNIDTRPIKDNPTATLAKARQIQRAALAPADPSAQDRAVAELASAMAAQAQQEINHQSESIDIPSRDSHKRSLSTSEIGNSSITSLGRSSNALLSQYDQRIGETRFEVSA